jgi:hypothetical protein
MSPSETQSTRRQYSRRRPRDCLLTTDAVAIAIRVSGATLRRWRGRGIGPPYLRLGPGKGGSIRYDPSDLATWLAGRRMGSEQAPECGSPAHQQPATPSKSKSTLV